MRRADASPPNPSQAPAAGGAAQFLPPDPRRSLGWGLRHEDRWLERWIRSTEDLARLQYSHRMLDAVIDEIDGRDIRIGEQWLTDYASCNYLGLDLEREIIEAIPEYLARWGTHPSWSWLLGSPVLYEEIETKLTELLGTEDSLVLPTITHIHMSVIPVLAGGGTLFLDSRAHKTIYDGCAVAKARGANVRRFAHNDLDELETLLKRNWRRPGMICIDGVNSMTGNAPDLAAFAELARRHDVLLYVDDAHGFGVGLASAVLGLGETFQLEVIAGGIEYSEQSITLKELGCETGQGFYFARPMEPERLMTYLDERAGDADVSVLPTGS